MHARAGGEQTTISIRFPIEIEEGAKSESGAETLKVFGRGSVSTDGNGNHIVDHHNDIIEPKELEPAVYNAVKEAADFDADHDGKRRGVLIESAFIGPEKVKAMGLAYQADAPARDFWWAGAELDDAETIKRVKSGELKELSIEYSAMRHVLDDDQPQPTKGRKSKALSERPVGRLRELKLHRLSLVDEGAGKAVNVTLCKRRATKSMDEMLKQLAALSDDEQKSIFQALSAKYGAPQPQQQQVPGADPQAQAASPPKPDEEKPMNDKAKEQPKPTETEGEKALKAQLAEMQKQLDTETKARELREAVDEAKRLGLEYLPGSLEEIAHDLLDIRRTKSKDEADKRIARMKATAEALKQSAILKNHGGRGAGAVSSGSAWEQIQAHAKSLREKDPQMSESASIERAAREHPELYNQIDAEREARVRS